ncbi:MAG TPA: aldo/keto reductase, partial [Polyangiaceae bacterium]|nr:aldo/keto reductase [Polyangiaceae bacterium]
YELGLQLVEELRPLIPKGVAMAPWALRWILMNDAVTCAIPGAKRPDQVTSNASAAELPALAPEAMQRILAIYNEKVRPLVHQRW